MRSLESGIWRIRKELLVLVSLALWPGVMVAQQKEGETPALKAATKTGVTTAKPSPVNSVPARGSTAGRVEIGEAGTASNVVLLALGETTLFRCPEPPLQLIFGEPAAFQVVEASAETQRSDFYLIPLRAGVSTGLWIEMASGVVQARLHTINLGRAARSGDYHAEVEVHPPVYRDSLASLKKQLTAAERMNRETEAEAQKQIASAEARAAEQKRAAALTGLGLMSALGQSRLKSKTKLSSTKQGRLSARLLLPALDDGRGGLWTLIELRLKGGKRSGTVLERIEASEANGRIEASLALPYSLGAKQAQRVAVAIRIGETVANAMRPSGLVLRFSGGSVLNLPLTR